MLSRFRFAELAEVELDDAVGFYEERAPGAGQALAREVFRTIQDAMEFPESGRRLDVAGVSLEVRRYVVSGVFPYQLIAGVEGGDCLTVFAVAHQRRDPRYWLRRLADPRG